MVGESGVGKWPNDQEKKSRKRYCITTKLAVEVVEKKVLERPARPGIARMQGGRADFAPKTRAAPKIRATH